MKKGESAGMLACFVIIAIIGICGPVRAESRGDCPTQAVQLAHADPEDGEYADIWADGNVAYQAQFGDNRVHFYDISDPDNPARFLEWTVPSAGFPSAQDVKVANGLLFIGLDNDQNESVEIVDVRDPFNPQHLTFINIIDNGAIHNVFYDAGYLYIVNSRDPRVDIIDLTDYDPDNPPASITEFKWRISVGIVFVHDITVENGRMYACAWDSGLHVYDVTDLANQPPVFLGSAPGISTHAVWPTPDGRWAVADEERSNGPVKLYEIEDNGIGGVTVTLRFTFPMPMTEAFSSHNPLVIGTRVYVAWYGAGMVVLDIDETAKQLVEVARLDTFPGVGGYDGVWGVYPFLGEDKLVISDIESGLYIAKLGPQIATVDYPDGLADHVDPSTGATLRVEIASACEQIDPATAKLLVDTSAAPARGSSFTEIPLEPVGGDVYEGQIPGANCGSAVSYYVTAETTEGSVVTDPPDAPSSVYSAEVFTEQVELLSQAFEIDEGWTVGDVDDNATTGVWERGDPNGSGAQPEDDHTEPGVNCFFTGQAPPGAGAGANDVDDGKTTLFSPVFDATGTMGDPYLGYWRWYSNNQGAAPNADVFVVDLSNDGGQSWTNVEVVGPGGNETAGGWILHQFRVGDVLAPTDQMMMRFVASDEGSGSVVEAAIDDFVLFDQLCGSCTDGQLNQGESLIDCGGPCSPCACLSDPDCTGFDICTGFESCDEFGTCQPGNEARLYGDVTGPDGGCQRDGTVNIFDILAVLDGFQDIFEKGCELRFMDLATPDGCGADGVVNVFDILSVLDAFQEVADCCGG